MNLEIIREASMKKTTIIYILFFIIISSCNPIETSTINPMNTLSIYSNITINPTPTNAYTSTQSIYPSAFRKTPTLEITKLITPTVINTTPISGNSVLLAFPNKESVDLSYIDLDTGKNGKDQNSDIEFIISCGADCLKLFWTSNGSRAYYFGMKKPENQDCMENNLFKEGDISPLPDDSYFCILTNKHNFSIVKLINSFINRDGSEIKYIYYETWSK